MTSKNLADLTTLRVGGPAGTYVEAATEAEFIDAIRRADDAGAPLLVLGGGSNVLAADAAFDGVVVRDARAEIVVSSDPACAGAGFTVTAGMPWDAVVERAVAQQWIGIECLSGIPGSTGATPVQNVGAYGQEVAGGIASVRTWDRAESRVRTLARIDCRFGYRTSLLKESMRGAAGRDFAPSPRYIVLDVTFQLRNGSLGAPIAYAQLADALGIQVGERAPSADVRAAVLELRRSKGMVLDASDPDTASAGSFFTNPVLTAQQAAELPDDAPRYPVGEGAPAGAVKTSAAWLIEHAGLSRGFALDGSLAALSSKHTLALTNRGGATAAELVDLARHVRAAVNGAFGVTLEPEPVLVGVEL